MGPGSAAQHSATLRAALRPGRKGSVLQKCDSLYLDQIHVRFGHEFVEANGARIPAIGLGTWDLRGRTCARMVEQALRLGYRHIDTAEMYDNEREVGEGLRASRRRRATRSLSSPRSGRSHFAPRELSARPRTAWRGCGCRVDLLLLHWPNPQIPLAETLGALCKVKRGGLRAPHRRLEFHGAADRGGGSAGERAARLQPGRDASLSRPVEGRRGVPRARHGRRRLQSDRARQCGQGRSVLARSARRTARPPRRFACASWCSRASASSRAPARSSAWRKIRGLRLSRLSRRRDGARSRPLRRIAAGTAGRLRLFRMTPKWD